MAVGRQDYQAGVVPVKSGYSLAQNNYFDYQGKNITAGGSQNFCLYTPALGYKLNVCGYRVATSYPFIHMSYLLIGATIVLGQRFDTHVIDIFPEGAVLEVNANENFMLQVHNPDEMDKWFDVAVYGYVEQIET